MTSSRSSHGTRAGGALGLLLALATVAVAPACGDDDGPGVGPDGGPRGDGATPPAPGDGGGPGEDGATPRDDGATVPPTPPPPPGPPPPPPGPCEPYATGPDPWAPAAAGTATFPEDHPRVLLRPEVRARLNAALASGARAATRFRDAVDAQVAGDADYYEFGPRNGALMYALTGETRYADWAIAGVEERVSAEEARIARGERAEIAADSYLYVGPTLDDVLSTYDWCFDRLTDAQRRRWLDYAQQAVWNVWHPDDARWGGASYPWSGWSTDDPQNNYFYSFLRATMLLGLAAHGEHPEADAWLDFFRRDRIGGTLVPNFAAQGRGGGSREGTGYGTSLRELFDLFAIWEASTGERLADLTPLGFDSMPHLVHAVVPTLDRLAPIGDHARDSTATLFDYHRAYLLALARLYEGSPVAAPVRTFLRDSSVPEMQNAFMFGWDFLYDPGDAPAAPLETLHPAYRSALAGQIYARSGWGRDATWLGVVAGIFDQSHAHHDQGSFLVYRGSWLAYDANVESHSGIRNEEELHNLVRFESAGEVLRMTWTDEPVALRALQNGPHFTWIALDARPAYARNDAARAAIAQADRELLFFPEGVLVVVDRVALAPGTTAPRMVWTLNTPARPAQSEGRWRVAGETSHLDVHPVLPAGATASVIDWAGADDDVGGGYRLELATTDAGPAFFLNVLSVDDAVSAVAPRDEPGRHGVTLTLAGGDVLEASFGESPDGAPRVTRRDGAGAARYDCALAPAVVDPPVLAR